MNVKKSYRYLLIPLFLVFFVGCGGSSSGEPLSNEVSNNRDSVAENQSTVAPVITITGSNPLRISQGETFSDPGATAKDNRGTTVTVTSRGTVDMDSEGSYTITYTAIDSSGNKSTAIRTVIVKAADVVWNVSSVAEFRQALEDAAANGENDTIVLHAGIYKTTSDGMGTFTFNDNEEYNLTIKSAEGLSYKDVILDGDNSHRVFTFSNVHNSRLSFNGVSVVNGNNSGIYAQKLQIQYCNISNNKGGGFRSNSVIVRNSIISKNSAKYSGGGFYSNEATVINSIISKNSAKKSGGGFYSEKATIIHSIISENSAGDNGGGFCNDARNAPNLNKTYITNSVISNNTASHGNGGGFYSSGNTIMVASSVLNNSAYYGGGFYFNKRAVVANSIFLNNNSIRKGVIYQNSHSKIESYIVNNSFINNNYALQLRGKFINNIFDSNNVDIGSNCCQTIYNNYIDYNKMENFLNNSNIIKKKNLQPSSVGDIYLSADKKSLTKDSPVIDKGLNPSSLTFKKVIDNENIYNLLISLLKIDMFGKNRIHNGTIDMGPMEYGSSR